ncbi:hypothetical protein ACQKMN_13305 [Ureibacillus composti]
MIRKTLITLVLALIVTFFFYPQKDSIISVFKMSDEPVVISKGHYGQSLIVEISFSHDGLKEWLQSLKQPYPLLMLDANWINRSPEIVELIKQKNITVGLLGGQGKQDYTFKSFKKDLSIYEKHFESKPLWFMTSDYEYPGELQKGVFNEEINLLSPTFILSKDDTFPNTKGAIISLKLNEKSNLKFDELNELLKKQKFISIEENIFGYSIKSKKLP